MEISTNQLSAMDYLYHGYYNGDLSATTPKELKAKVEYGLRLAHFLDLVDRNCPEWEYVSGYKDYRSEITLRCKECGALKKISYQTLNHIGKPRIGKKGYSKTQNRVKCSRCAENRKAEEDREKQYLKDYASFQLETYIKCRECGKVFYDIPTNRFCSKECKEKYNLEHKRQPRKLPISAITDETKDITLPKLYIRDQGRCYLCGGQCDFTVDSLDGNYPTIEHIVPVSKGGKDCWDNIKLAHRKCNAFKNVKTDLAMVVKTIRKRYPSGH